jgi:hypothetical protein
VSLPIKVRCDLSVQRGVYPRQMGVAPVAAATVSKKGGASLQRYAVQGSGGMIALAIC